METIFSFGNWIRKQRKALDLTQKALADRVGCSVAAIKKIEGEERRPSRQIAERLADILGVPTNRRETFLDVARGIKPIEQLFSAPMEDRSPHNMPAQLTSFIGRKHELAEVKSLLSSTRLLTLIGPGGTGKTRLALQIGQEVLPAFANGVWSVELAQLTDSALIPHAIASVLGLQEAPKTPLMNILVNYLHNKQLLLILDNCEHLVNACAFLSADLLSVSPQLKILVSSREALGISGETIYRVPSLSLSKITPATYDFLMQSEAAQLFIDRAQAVQPRFVLQDKYIPAIVQICNRLDGIPLALELAAARMAVFSAEEIASRLDDRFRLLTGGSRTALERHQTLRALIDWSYDLLTENERKLFRQLSVFSGGWTYEAAEAIFPELDVLNLLTQLVNKSLVMVNDGEHGTRYRLPETIRQYARDKLLDSGEAETVRDQHLEFFLHFAENAEPKLRGPNQVEWLTYLEIDHDNLRAALSWSLEGKKTAEALSLVGSLYYFWGFRGHWTEGKNWFSNSLALAEHQRKDTPTESDRVQILSQRAKALYGGAWMALLILGASEARRMIEESLALWRQLGNQWWTAVALELFGLILASEGDYLTARTRVEEGVSIASKIDDPWPLAVCLVRLGDSLKGKDLAAAREYLERGIATGRIAGDKSVLSEGLRELGSVYFMQGNLSTAMIVTEEALVEARALGSLVQEYLAMFQRIVIACFQEEPTNARAYCAEFWALGKDKGNPLVWLLAPLTFGLVAIFNDQARRGVCLLSASDALALRYGVKLNVEGESIYVIYQQALIKARQQLTQADFEAAQREGRALTMEQAIALATEEENSMPLSDERTGPSRN